MKKVNVDYLISTCFECPYKKTLVKDNDTTENICALTEKTLEHYMTDIPTHCLLEEINP